MTVPDTSATTPTHINDEAWDELRRADNAVRRHEAEYARLGWDLTPMLERRDKARRAVWATEREAMAVELAHQIRRAIAAEGSLASLLADLNERAEYHDRCARFLSDPSTKAAHQKEARDLRALRAKYTPDTTTGGKP